MANFLNYAGLLSKREHARSFTEIWRSYERRIPICPKTIEKAENTFYEETGRWPSGNAMRSARGNTKAANALIGDDNEPPRDLHHTSGRVMQDVSRRYPRVVPTPIKVVAVWDTVGSMGLPGLFVNPDKSRYLTFFDPILAPNVEYAFHALALDEDRKDFRPTLWYIPPPNREVEGDRKHREKQLLKQVSRCMICCVKQCSCDLISQCQVWFQGSHSDVGGGFPWHGLSVSDDFRSF